MLSNLSKEQLHFVEFIAQLDADDYLLPNAIDRLIYKIKRCSDADIVYGKYKVLRDGELTDGWSCRESTREMRIPGYVLSPFTGI